VTSNLFVRPSLERSLETAITASLSPDLLSPAWKNRATGALSGHCYVASEAAWHLLGGMDSPWRPCVGRYGDITHWWLECEGRVLDLTAAQFPNGFDYSTGRKCGFLTSKPSKRAATLIDRVLALSNRSATSTP
jgi:hypothetical protein